MALGNYKDIVLNNFSGGLNTRYLPNLIDDSQSPSLQNVVFDDKGSLLPRKGITQFGSALSAIVSATSGSIHSTFTFNKRDGSQVPVIWSLDKMFYYHADLADWRLLQDGYSSGASFGADSFANSQVDEAMYFGNAVDTMWRWNGRYGMVSGAFTNTDTVCYLSTSRSLSALGWQTSGSAIIGTEAFTYASLSANALSSITRTSAATSYATQTAIAQFPLSSGFTSAPRGNIYKMHQNRLNIAGVSNNPTAIYYSKIVNPLNFSYSSPLSAGDGGIADFPEGGGAIKGIGVKEQNLLAFKNNNIKALAFSTDDLPQLQVVVDGLNVGANNNNIEMVENGIFYVNPMGDVKQLEREVANNPMQVFSMSELIRPTLQQMSIDNSKLSYYDYKTHVALATSGSAFNNAMLLYDYTYKAWTKFAGLNASSFFTYGTDLLYGAANEAKVYQMYTNYDDNGYAYDAYWNSKQIDFGFPHEQKRLRYLYLEGYMTENCSLSASVTYNDDGSPITKVINGNASYIQNNITTEIFGRSTFGKGTLGGTNTNTQFILRKFQVRLSYSNVDFFDMQVKVQSNKAGAVWKLTHIVPYVEPMPSKKFPESWVI